ncbi:MULTISPECIES: exodeoxyribonuclease VII large subunit [unclassified Candidatus Frackibacter]|uniref:exodeoxyribonuclease VII large subunit n=1 Tax=unclassified Candidatus Frackibacter TaxID=2648818 RepID=UPI0008918077|nr:MULTISPECIES: exodeoxyribonuclease VII large subunit [unclassified Candidatus Frackibacter]SDC02780.1 Exodeoxyribonuclease VII large subunit [Candidatus Frackibacter sp. WG11]SEM69511.1 Exodeoxyribonuclease VII large subunit [Candidatus Frackibacter sp. WG12]SFL80770.1 Exodeoxyribonuclease VII large subunit [Candidatus Frackibacter sp. WG13]
MQQKVITVTELTKYIKDKLENDELLSNLLIAGEISNFHHHGSGHMYFTLKDKKTQINSVMFKSANQRLQFEPEDGMKILATGYVSLYEPRGQYQLYVQSLQPDGIGALHIAFEQLKERLQKEGLFEEEHKQELPKLPQKIGVITSPTGAAVRDILSVIKRRFSGVSILIAPATVQGERAVPTLVDALERLNAREDIDVIIIGRGGGSLEDLWAFNEEELARAIFNSNTPVISAVGHETDYTISDFVADLRAPTPSAAAELVISNQEELARYLNRLNNNLKQSMKQKLKNLRNKVNNLTQRRVLLEPKRQLQDSQQRVDELEARLINKIQSRLDYLQEKFQTQAGKLDSMSPLKVLRRGYSYCQKVGQDQGITSVNEVDPGEELEMVLSDGKIKSRVLSIDNEQVVKK